MATKQARGTKRTCQSDDCGSRFYDLNRDPIVCPICGSIYEIASGPVGVLFKDEEKAPRKAKKEIVKEDDAVDVADEEIGEIAEDDAVEADADDTFLEEEAEDGGGMTSAAAPRTRRKPEVLPLPRPLCGGLPAALRATFVRLRLRCRSTQNPACSLACDGLWKRLDRGAQPP
jgi:uncharacterized protein (TIGR02300 family)